MTVFDQWEQAVTYQYNVQGTINFGAVQTPPDLVAELRKVQAEVQQATATGAVQGETATNARHQLLKAVHEAEKPQPDKKKAADYLAQAKAATSAGVPGQATTLSLIRALRDVEHVKNGITGFVEPFQNGCLQEPLMRIEGASCLVD